MMSTDREGNCESLEVFSGEDASEWPTVLDGSSHECA